MNEELRQVTEAAKSPLSYDLLTYFWVFALSAWGGSVRFARKVKAKEMSLGRALRSLLVEMMTSAFAGVVTFFLCEGTGITGLWTAVLVAVAGHMGGRALEPLEALYKRWIGGKADE